MSISHPKEDEDGGLLQSEDEPWIRQINALWDTHFKQRELPTKDKQFQVNLGNETNPKPIFINENLSSFEREDIIQLIGDYIDVFIWSYEDMPRLIPYVPMHQLNDNP